MKGIIGYSRPGPHGGVQVDTEAMMVDLVTVAKAGGITREQFLTFATQTWDKVEVSVTIPKGAKN